jgi:hypothetical protein
MSKDELKRKRRALAKAVRLYRESRWSIALSVMSKEEPSDDSCRRMRYQALRIAEIVANGKA